MTYDYNRAATRRVTANMDLRNEYYAAMERVRAQTRMIEKASDLRIMKEVAHMLANFDLVLDVKGSSLEMVRVGSDQWEAWAYLFIQPAKGSKITEEGVKMAVWDVTRQDPKFIKWQNGGWMVRLSF